MPGAIQHGAEVCQHGRHRLGIDWVDSPEGLTNDAGRQFSFFAHFAHSGLCFRVYLGKPLAGVRTRAIANIADTLIVSHTPSSRTRSLYRFHLSTLMRTLLVSSLFYLLWYTHSLHLYNCLSRAYLVIHQYASVRLTSPNLGELSLPRPVLRPDFTLKYSS